MDNLNISDVVNFVNGNVLMQQLCVVIVYMIAAKAIDVLLDRGLKRLIVRFSSRSGGGLIDYIHRPVYLTVFGLGLLHALLLSELSMPWQVVLPAIINSIMLLVWVFAFSKVIGLLRAEQFTAILSRYDISVDIFNLCRKIGRIFIFVLGGIGLLSIWNVNLTPLFASAGIAGIAIALAVKDTLANFFGGISMFLDKAYKAGDYIILGTGERGEVVDIGMRSTRLKTRDDVLITLPNSILATTMIINESAPEPSFRIRIPVGVAYGTDVDKVEAVLLRVASANPQVVAVPEARVRMRAFGSSSIDFELLCWVKEPSLKGLVTHELLKKIFYTFKSEDITIPFPQMDVHLQKSE